MSRRPLDQTFRGRRLRVGQIVAYRYTMEPVRVTQIQQYGSHGTRRITVERSHDRPTFVTLANMLVPLPAGVESPFNPYEGLDLGIPDEEC